MQLENGMLSNEIDRPPAGVGCASCKLQGHFCPASQYIGDSGVGECDDCAHGRPCGAMLARAALRNNEHNPVDEDLKPGPVKSLKDQNRCVVSGCHGFAAPNGSYCSTNHYAELVAERKERAAVKGRKPPIPGSLDYGKPIDPELLKRLRLEEHLPIEVIAQRMHVCKKRVSAELDRLGLGPLSNRKPSEKLKPEDLAAIHGLQKEHRQAFRKEVEERVSVENMRLSEAIATATGLQKPADLYQPVIADLEAKAASHDAEAKFIRGVIESIRALKGK